MDTSMKIIILISSLVFGIAFTAMAAVLGLHLTKNQPTIDLSDVRTPAILSNHTIYLLRKEIVKVTDGVHVAVGYDLANSIMIEAPEGLIIVDTLGTHTGAREIIREFKKIANKPIRAIIATHFHVDHNYAIDAFLETEPPGQIDVWTYESQRSVHLSEALIWQALRPRNSRQGGFRLTTATGFRNNGIGHHIVFDDNDNYTEILTPTKTFSTKSQAVTIAGLEMIFLHIPGETPDQMAVWVPSKKVLCPADDYYHTFPNIYAIRGTAVRNINDWIQSIDVMRALNAEYLVPSHTHPLSGEKLIQEQLTHYRDAIQLVHDQTVRYINKGFHPDKIVQMVQLPPNLADKTYLRELYGMVSWSVRSVFNQYLGWFSGSVQELEPMSLEEKAPLLIKLAGGTANVLKAANDALNGKNYKWALELSTNILAAESNNIDAKEIRYKALKEMAGDIVSPNGRYYYLTTILEDWGMITYNTSLEEQHQRIRYLPIDIVMRRITISMKSNECYAKDIIGMFTFTDVNLTYVMHMRHGVIDLQKKTVTNWNFSLITTKTNWIDALIAQNGFKSATGIPGATVDDKESLIPVFFSCVEDTLGLYY